MALFDKLTAPVSGSTIKISGQNLIVPDNPIIPFIEGDGIGPDIMNASTLVWNCAVEQAYKGSRKIEWFEIFAGEKAMKVYNGNVLPDDTLKAINEYIVAIKGPLTTPVGGGYRSLNVTLRQKLDLYACVRPVRYFAGVPSPVCKPELMNIIIFRENTEDVYAGIEWKEGTKEALDFIEFVKNRYNISILKDSGVGVKPISISATKRLVRKAIRYAIEHKKKSVTLVHKGNIMKFTEGAFRDWGYELARTEFGEFTISEKEVSERFGGKAPKDKIVIKDRIADSMFQQILTRTDEYEVVALPNLNGDYLSDACAAQIGGLGLAPGANIGDFVALFEATHGTAPKYAGQDKVNPGSLILSGVMMLEYIGWNEAAELIPAAMEETILAKEVTYDLARLMDGVQAIKSSAFGAAICKRMKQL